MLVGRELRQLRAPRRLPHGPVFLGNDPQEQVVRVAAVGVFLRLHVEAVGMQVRGVRRVLAVDMALERPAGHRFRAEDLEELVREDRREATLRVLLVLDPEGLDGRAAHGIAHVRREVEKIHVGPYAGLLPVQAQLVAQPDAQRAVGPHPDRWTGAHAVVTEQPRRRVARRGGVSRVLVADHVQLERFARPPLGPPGPGL